MSLIRDGLADQAMDQKLAPLGEARTFTAYRVCVVKQDVTTSSGQAFKQGSISIATPDTFEMRGDAHHMVYCRATATHVALKPAQLTFITSDKGRPR